MSRTPANDNNQRPAEFDARVMAYMPGLKALSRKYYRNWEQADDLVTDTIALALEKWRDFREDGGLWLWLYWTMRGIVSNQLGRRRLQMVDDRIVYSNAKQDPWQEGYAEVSQVIGQLEGRDGAILLRRAMGDGLVEVAKRHGITKQRAQQIETRARNDLRRAHGLPPLASRRAKAAA